MSLCAEEIIKIMEKAKELGLTTLKVDGMEVGISPPPQTPKIVPDFEADEIYKELSALDQMSDEELLYYSTPYYDHLQQLKEEKKQRIEDEVSHDG